jgi:hypothetical protein
MLLVDVDAACLVLTNASIESPSMRIRAWTKLCDAFDQSVAQAPHYFVPEFQKLIEEEFSNNDDELHAALRMSDPDLVVRILPSSMVSFVGYRR